MTAIKQLVWNPDEQRPRALVRLASHVLALFVIGNVVALLAALLGIGPIGGLTMTGTLGIAGVVALATWLNGTFVDRRPFAGFGFHLDRRWWLDCIAGVVIGALLMGGIFVLEWALGWLTIVDRRVGDGQQSFALGLLGSLVAFVAVGFYEELVSRGYHLRNIAEGLRSNWLTPKAALLSATLLSSLVFGLGHIGNDNATWISTINIAGAGCMLAVGLLWTGELALPIGLHIGWNFFQGNVFGFPVSGNPMPVRVFAIEQGGDELITGGVFGPEAGIVGLVAMVVGVTLMAAWVRVTRGSLHLHGELSSLAE